VKNQTAEKILDNTFRHLEEVLKNQYIDNDDFVKKTALQAEQLCRQRHRKKSGSRQETNPEKRAE